MHDADVIDALTAQVNELAQVCGRLSKENADLRSQMSALSSRPRVAVEPATSTAAAEPEGLKRLAGRRISRRAVGAAAAGLAAGAVGSAVFTGRDARPVAAATATQVTSEESTHAELTAAQQAAPAVPVGPGSIVSGIRATDSGVLSGTNTASGPGIQGANTGVGPGVTGTSKSGRGGVFSGGVAQIRLVPGNSSHPKSGERGDLYADANGRLWFCTTGGTTATWRQIA